MNRSSFTLIATVALLLMTPRAALAEFKLAVVDLNRVLNESTESKDSRKSLDDLSQKARKKIDAKKVSVAALEKKVKEGRFAEDSKEVQSFNTEARDFNRLIKDSEEEVKREFLKINKELTEKAVRTVKSYAKNKGLDLVVDRSEKNRGPILFGSEGIDITDDIISLMNGA